MNTELNIPDSVEKLLRSNIEEDVIIGIAYIYTKWGKEGIKSTFDGWRTASLSSAKYITKKSENDLFGTYIDYDDINVWIGPGWIEYGRDISTLDLKNCKYINNKT